MRFGRFVNDQEGNHRGDAYIALAKFLLDSRRGGSEYDQSHLPPGQQYEAVGHAVRAMYFYSGMADIAAETHDRDYQSAVISLWDNMVNKKYYLTGGIGSGETSEGFGPNYSLRNEAYCETCSSCGVVFSSTSSTLPIIMRSTPICTSRRCTTLYWVEWHSMARASATPIRW